MSRHIRILHLEDDPEWIDIVRKALSGFVIRSARTLEEAFELYKDTDFDLAILDISLIPDDSQDAQGELLLKGLEGLSILPGKRIIILSAYLSGANQDRMRRYFKFYKVLDAVPKQKFDPKEFRRTIEVAFEDAI